MIQLKQILSLTVLSALVFLQCSVNNTTKKAETTNTPKPSLNEQLATPLPLNKIKLPEGFKIDLFATGIPNARGMCLSPNGTLYVGSRQKGVVTAIRDNNGDFKADEILTIATGLKMPVGVAFKDGDLYVSDLSRIVKLSNIENNLKNPPKPTVVYDKLPKDEHHGWKYIAFGPDGKLYVPVGAPCNICEPEKEIYASITRMNPDGTGFEIVQKGVRNTVGFTWHPKTKELWFTDNGRDMMGDDMPSCELNRATKDGMHFGYPYCHQGDVLDPEFGKKRKCEEFTPPAAKLGPHVAPLGLKFIQSKQFPANYQGGIIVAEHGSWNRTTPLGYRLAFVSLDKNSNVSNTSIFADGWLNEDNTPWGRPVDVEWLPDGSLLVSDDFADVIYRISKQ